MSSSSSSIPATLKQTDGHTIPHFGIGVWEMRGPSTTTALQHAVHKVGYRQIDTAQYYRNESHVGDFVNSSEVPREQLYVVTKTFTKGAGAYDSILRSLSEAKMDYWDLVLIHAPDGGKQARAQTWDALSKLVEEGKVRSLGVSNYGEGHIKELMDSKPRVLPVVNQIECHPFFAQRELRNCCASNGILVQAYCPLARGQYYSDKTLKEVASSIGKTPAQVMLRWSLQEGMIPLPKSSHEGRQKENWDTFAGGWSLDEEAMRTLAGLDRGASGAIEVQTMSQDAP